MWRVWIEITLDDYISNKARRSPSVWRVWIEIMPFFRRYNMAKSPSVWRVWIEMDKIEGLKPSLYGHPPCGGCGLKWLLKNYRILDNLSPSVWRVWIEIKKPST